MRKGIMAAGNWIIDHVKLIDRWPSMEMLANIVEEFIGTGGAPYNVLMNLAKLKTDIPLYAAGVIGTDQNGDFIINDLNANNIDYEFMCRTTLKPTSYTDVMTEKNKGRRTFFHCRGANALLDMEHFTKINTNARLFHLGYLLLLDSLDQQDEKHTVKAARVLKLLQDKGYKTSVDVVSEDSNRYKEVVTPCLQYIDYLILNEIEAGATTGLQIRKKDHKLDETALQKAADILMVGGVREVVVIHFPEGGYALDKAGNEFFVPSYQLDGSQIKSSVGAGDAFCAGMLLGLHEGLPLKECLKLANTNAVFCLMHATSTGGAVPLETVKEFIAKSH